MSIYIFSRPIHSGKTTELLHWCNRHKNIRGILMPDIDGSRKILDLSTKEIFDIECTNVSKTKEPVTRVGRFHFYLAVFEKANSILLDALAQNPDWVVIDEAGKLELECKGFYEAIKTATEKHNSLNANGNLLITVRDSLCEEVISFFKMNNHTIIHHLDELI